MFVLKEIQPVMELDSLNASHPLSLKESEVETTSDILGLFDSITYNKAGWSLFTAHKFEGSCIYLSEIIYVWLDEQDSLASQ